MPDGRALSGFSHEYRRHGTSTLFAALTVATGMVKAGHFKRRRRREFLQFMNEVIADYPDQEVHVILDNISTHKPKQDLWLARHPNVRFHYNERATPFEWTKREVGPKAPKRKYADFRK